MSDSDKFTYYLSSLATQLQSQFSLGENTTHSLDKVIDGQTVKYGALGEFASKIDQSSERKYLENGFLRRDSANVDTKLLEILMQEPSATVLVKKRMLSSLGENYRPEYMDNDEKLYYKSMKVLFQNKCRQISALEKLSKIQKISAITGQIDDQLMPILFTLSDQFSNSPSSVATESYNFTNSGGSSNTSMASFQEVMGRVRRLYSFNSPSYATNWITDSSNLFQSQFGEGTGVIEITNFTNVNTTTNLTGSGRCSLGITDPYNMMVITEYDIEKAISDASNLFNNHKTFQFGKDAAEQVINSLNEKLNTLRNGRQASPITFKINPDTLLSRKVIAIFDSTGTELIFEYDFFGTPTVSVQPEYLKDGVVAGYDGLSTERVKSVNGINKLFPESELDLFQQLVAAIFSKINLDTNSQNSFQQSNKNTNYARKKLRFNFLGKLIIQPFDPIHIYINSKSKYDNRLLSGLKTMFTGVNFLQAAGGAFSDIRKQGVELFKPSDLTTMVEKSAFVGPEFPSFLWSLLRTQFVTEKEGTHVFAGVVNTANSNYSRGEYTVDISASDNYKYLTLGNVNFNPSADAWNGVFYDPLTPFKSKFDTVSTNFKNESPELLEENQVILGIKSDGSGSYLKAKSGPNAGRVVTKDNYIQDKTVDPITKRFTRTFYAPDGLVYKWKEGIGAFVQFGSSFDLNSPNNVGIPSITQEAFAGQDVINVIALAVTGVPYNFATYWNAVTKLNGFGRDPQSQEDPSRSFFNSLQSDLIKRNSLWGNFIPFKTLSVNENAYKQYIFTLARIEDNNRQIEEKLKKLAQINYTAITVSSYASTDQAQALGKTTDTAAAAKISDAATKLSKEVNDLMNKVKQDNSVAFVQVGDSISFNADSFYYKEDEKSVAPKTRKFLRRQVNFLTRRMSYAVRANEDKNLFIVDDSYDKDYDIAAFNSALTSQMELYKNSFLTVDQKIKTAANLLNLEVFCDTQGHIRVRPPHYNRMPSSVFYKMMYQKQAFGIQVFPQFLDDLFSEQLTTLRERLEIVEDYIRFDCAILGYLNDLSAQKFVNGPDNSTVNPGEPFAFVSNSEGIIADISQLITQKNPDTNLGQNNQQFPGFNAIQRQASSTKDIFTNSQRYSYITQVLSKTATNPSLADNPFDINNTVNFETNVLLNTLKTRIENKSGQKISLSSIAFVINNADVFQVATDQGNTNSAINVDIFKVTKDLASKLSERQRLIKLFASSLVNVKEYRSLDDDTGTSNKLLVSGAIGNDNIPEVFEHMIEDESYDDYGPDAGKRYVIKNSQIINYNFAENLPEYTTVEVQGTLISEAPDALPAGLASFPSGGNALVTARAVDYDLWRNYGLLGTNTSISVPFLRDPNNQCAPYAVSLLSRARNNIIRGSITLSGNEYYQPGEVVFIEDKGLLFYVESVNHSYNQGRSFNTTLNLSYGHSPGEYIPTTLDIIGKLLFNNKDIANIQVQRQNSSFNESNYGAIIYDPNDKAATFNPPKDGNVGGAKYGPANATVINNILYNASSLIYTQNAKENNVSSKIELRVYYDSKKTNFPETKLINFALYIKEILRGNVTINQQDASNNNINNVTFPEESIQIVEVDVSSKEDHRSPSSKAMSISRDLTAQAAALIDKENADAIAQKNRNTAAGTDKISPDPRNKVETDKQRKALFSYVVDCWVKLNVVSPQATNPTTGT